MWVTFWRYIMFWTGPSNSCYGNRWRPQSNVSYVWPPLSSSEAKSVGLCYISHWGFWLDMVRIENEICIWKTVTLPFHTVREMHLCLTLLISERNSLVKLLLLVLDHNFSLGLLILFFDESSWVNVVIFQNHSNKWMTFSHFCSLGP